MKETRWALIPDYENYIISDKAEVINITTGKIVSVSKHKQGYRVVRVWKNNTTRLMKIYRLLAILFIPNPENKIQVNHLDGNRMNESLGNLEWVTASENMKHAFKNGLSRGHFEKGSGHPLRKLSHSNILEIRMMRKQGYSLKELSAKFGVGPSHICSVSIHTQTIELEYA